MKFSTKSRYALRLMAELRFDFSELVFAVFLEALTALMALLMASVLSAASLTLLCMSSVCFFNSSALSLESQVAVSAGVPASCTA